MKKLLLFMALALSSYAFACGPSFVWWYKMYAPPMDSDNFVAQSPTDTLYGAYTMNRTDTSITMAYSWTSIDSVTVWVTATSGSTTFTEDSVRLAPNFMATRIVTFRPLTAATAYQITVYKLSSNGLDSLTYSDTTLMGISGPVTFGPLYHTAFDTLGVTIDRHYGGQVFVWKRTRTPSTSWSGNIFVVVDNNSMTQVFTTTTPISGNPGDTIFTQFIAVSINYSTYVYSSVDTTIIPMSPPHFISAMITGVSDSGAYVTFTFQSGESGLLTLSWSFDPNFSPAYVDTLLSFTGSNNPQSITLFLGNFTAFTTVYVEGELFTSFPVKETIDTFFTTTAGIPEVHMNSIDPIVGTPVNGHGTYSTGGMNGWTVQFEIGSVNDFNSVWYTSNAVTAINGGLISLSDHIFMSTNDNGDFWMRIALFPSLGAPLYSNMITFHFPSSTTGINEYDNQISMSAFPNPCTDAIHLKGKPGDTFFVTDVIGRRIFDGVFENEGNSLGVSSWKSGTYVISSPREKGVRFIKQ